MNKICNIFNMDDYKIDHETHSFCPIFLGRKLVKVEMTPKQDGILFTFDDFGHRFLQCHMSQCCETAIVTQVDGDWEDLYGQTISLAEESVGRPAGEEDYRGNQWTFYTIGCPKGRVSWRWQSDNNNGYYSESVDLHEAWKINDE